MTLSFSAIAWSSQANCASNTLALTLKPNLFGERGRRLIKGSERANSLAMSVQVSLISDIDLVFARILMLAPRQHQVSEQAYSEF